MEKNIGHAKSATVAIDFVTGLLAGTRRKGHSPESLLAAAGIDVALLETERSRIPLATYADLYNRVALALDDEAFGLFSTPMRCGSFELLVRALAGSGTLDTAFERMTRYLRVLLPDMAVTVMRHGRQAELSLTAVQPSALRATGAGRIFAFEWLLRLIHGLACWLVGRGLPLDAVSFPYPRPRHADDYALIYTADSNFTSEHPETLTARFQAHLLGLPVRRDDTALGAFLLGAPGRITTLYRRDRDTVQRVRDILRSALPASPDLDAVAAAMHLSPRSLHRRLADEGANFRRIKDALRRDLALARLARRGTRIAQLAGDLGYADTSSFYRAFLTWTGVTPSDYRKNLSNSVKPAESPP